MSKQNINLGNALNDGTGDVLRVGGEKINSNFTELYNALGGESGAPLSIVSGLRAGSGIVLSSKTGDVLVTAQPATRNDPGVVKIGTGLNITDGVVSAPIYTLPVADGNILGGIKVGARLSINPDGVLSADPGAYTLPIAQAGVLGGVKVGTGLSIDPSTGVLSSTITQYALPTATNSVLGGVKVGSRLTITDGVLSADVQVGSVTALNNGVHSLALTSTGKITLPGSGVAVDTDQINNAGADTVIYTTNNTYIRAVKLLVFAEKFVNGYESQACEVIGTIDENANIIYTSTYGIVYTGATPLFTISNDYDIPTQSFIIMASPTGIDNIRIRTHVTEMYGTD
jgi:hypothetical protein